MQSTNPIILALIAIFLFVYTFMCVDVNHYFMINTAWDSSLIEARIACYLIAGLGLCLATFYKIFSDILYSKSLIVLHVILYLLLTIIMILWDNNSFSFQKIVDSRDYNSIGEVKSEYRNILDKDHAYRVIFWVLLSTQTIGLLNLILGFFKSNKD